MADLKDKYSSSSNDSNWGEIVGDAKLCIVGKKEKNSHSNIKIFKSVYWEFMYVDAKLYIIIILDW